MCLDSGKYKQHYLMHHQEVSIMMTPLMTLVIFLVVKKTQTSNDSLYIQKTIRVLVSRQEVPASVY